MHNAAGPGIDPIEHRSGCSAGGSPRLEGSSCHKFPLPRFRRCHTEQNIAPMPFPSINPVSLLQHQQRSIPARRGRQRLRPLSGPAPTDHAPCPTPTGPAHPAPERWSRPPCAPAAAPARWGRWRRALSAVSSGPGRPPGSGRPGPPWRRLRGRGRVRGEADAGARGWRRGRGVWGGGPVAAGSGREDGATSPAWLWPPAGPAPTVPRCSPAASEMSADMLPGPYPRTPEERAAAAKKYNMRVEDYQPYPDDGMG